MIACTMMMWLESAVRGGGGGYPLLLMARDMAS